MKRRIRRKIRGKQGVSLGEMLACVALVSLVSTIAVAAILMAYQKTNKLLLATYRQQLGTTLMERIIEELSEATNDPDRATDKTVLFFTTDPSPASEKNEAGEVISSSHMREGSTQIIFRDATGIRTRIYINQENHLEIWYQKSVDSQKEVPDSYWRFSGEAYHGLEVKDLQFEFLQSAGTDAEETDEEEIGCVYLKVTLTLGHPLEAEELETFTATTPCYMIPGNVVDRNVFHF